MSPHEKFERFLTKENVEAIKNIGKGPKPDWLVRQEMREFFGQLVPVVVGIGGIVVAMYTVCR